MEYSSSNGDQPINGGENLIYDVKLSSVVPASVTAEQNRHHELTNMDLIMKLHYITTVHFFDRDAAEGLEINDLKLPMFKWLETYYPVCGRIRRTDGGGRPYVKCNDGGVRVVEAKCVKTIDEWRAEIGYSSKHDLLVYSQPLGTDLEFTPLVFLQVTKFKCGRICVGMSWSHVLGDAFSASNCINTWGNMFTESQQSQNLKVTPVVTNHGSTREIPILPSPTCRSLKPLNPPGDKWLISNSRKMQSHTFHVRESLLTKFDGGGDNKPFELISALIWKTLAKIRGIDSEPKVVTVIRKGYYCKTGGNELLGNRNQAIGIVEAPMVKVSEADSLDLARVMIENFVEENEKIMEKENGNADFVVYGSNLTFVDLEEVKLYGLRVKGREPVFANLSIGGADENGVVIVLPPGKLDGNGRIVNVILPEDELEDLKSELGREWLI